MNSMNPSATNRWIAMSIQLFKVIFAPCWRAKIGPFQTRFVTAYGENRVRQAAVGVWRPDACLSPGAAIQLAVYLC